MKSVYAAAITAFLFVAILAGCGAKDNAQYGDTVTVQYVGKLQDGSVFDSTTADSPLEITLGQTQIISGFENALVGMEVGDTKSVTLEPPQAYGVRRDDLTQSVPIDSFPEDLELFEGQTLNMPQPNGQTVQLRVTEISEDSMVTIDANHPLAGETLIFDITLTGIEKGAGMQQSEEQGGGE